MKCKHCQQIFQARSKNGAAAPAVMAAAAPATARATPVGISAKTPVPAVPVDSTSLNFDSPLVATAPQRPVRRKKGGWWKGLVLLGIVLAVSAGVWIFAGPHLSGLFGTQKGDGDKNKVAEGKKLKTGSTEPEAKNDAPVEPPKKGAKKGTEASKKQGGTVVAGAFPRRALLINVSNYLLFNPLHYGNERSAGYPGSSSNVLSDTLNRPPMNVPATQITELSDAGKNPFSTAKPVIEKTIADFVDSSREQDRIIVLFTGHAIEIEKEAYLVPVEGNREDAKTLIPVSWVFDKLAKCKARQKLLVLDVFRYPPARGEELPGTGEMTEDFEAKLLTPPAGVQVWASCTKGQQSIELEGGSVFMQALCTVLQERLPGIQEPTSPIPLDTMVPKVNQRLKEILAPQKLEQLARLYGTHVEEGGVAYNPKEPLPLRLVLKPVVPTGTQAAGLAMVKNIMDELTRLPPVKVSQRPLQATSLPLFDSKVLEDYQADYKTWNELTAMTKDKEKYPLRAAVLDAIQVMEDSKKITMRESLTNPGGPITAATKKEFANQQKEPGIMIFQMEKSLAELKAAGEQREKETSKRWLANYDYALARLQSRLVYIYEYNNILALVRSDSLPTLESIHNGWRVGSQKKVGISEPKVKDMVKSIAKTWKRIGEENPNTPWAILAARENMTALGLVWRPSRD